MPLTRLRAKYQTRAPRYTSYPPANVFAELQLERVWAAWATAAAERALYVHVPFCKQRCWFCACQVEITSNQERIDRYVDWLITDLERRMSMFWQPRHFSQVAFGGGTPTSLGLPGLARLMDAIRPHVAPDAEQSIELDPRGVQASDAAALVAMGFNRFSVGVQDLDASVLRSVHREQSPEAISGLMSSLRDAGARSINLDLIYGLPGQTVQTMEDTAAWVVARAPDRIALYGYAHVPQLKPQQKLLERAGLPTDRAALFDVAAKAFSAAGYVPVGFDHFAKPHDELASTQRLHRNFMGYTTKRGIDLVGIGASAISDINGVYTQNNKSSEAYGEAIEAGRDPIERGHVLSPEDNQRRELILDLFCNLRTSSDRLGLNAPLRDVFAAEYVKLADLAADGLVVLQPDAIVLTDLGRHFVRNVCAVFDRYLPADNRLHSLVH